MVESCGYDAEKLKATARDVYSNFMDKTDELVRMREDRISGLVEKLNDSVRGEVDFPSLYQYEGVQFLMDNKRVLVADEMGTGKTAQALAGKIELENRLGRKVRTLVIAPSEEMRDVWEYRAKNEYLTPERAKEMKVLNIDLEDIKSGDGQYKAKIDEADLVVMDYNALSFSETKPNNHKRKSLKKWLMDSGFEYVILDEAHNIKNFATSQRHGHTKGIADKAEYLALLSGTCAPNSIQDVYSLIALLHPRREIEVDGENKVVGYGSAAEVQSLHSMNPAAIGAILRSLRLERKLDTIMKHLPQKVEEEYVIEMSPSQRRVYDTVFEDDTLTGMGKITALKKAMLNPELLDKSHRDVGKCKFEAVDRIIQSLPKGEKIVIYSPQLREGVLDKLESRYEMYGALVIDGTNKADRGDIIKKFQTDPNHRVLVMNDVAGEGICLTAANNLVFLEEPFSPGERKQVIGRIYRPGQAKKVKVKTLRVKSTLDDGLKEYAKKKNLAIDYVYKGIPLSDDLKEVFGTVKGIEDWLEIRTNHLYTPSQITSRLIKKLIEKPEEKVVKALNQDNRGERQSFGQHLADSIARSWEGSALENSANVYAAIVKGIGKRKKLGTMLDIASGFGGLSKSLGVAGVVNIDANKYNFRTDKASKDNKNCVGKMTQIPLADSSVDLALCSMALDILPNTEQEPARAKAIAEANRVLKQGGEYIIVLPGPDVKEHEADLLEGMVESGFEPVPELTGFVNAKDKEIGTYLYVLTARKARKTGASTAELRKISEKLGLNSRQKAKKKGATQRRSGTCREFEFTRQNGEIESIDDAIRRYYESQNQPQEDVA